MNKDMENTFNRMAELGGSDERLGRSTGPVINAPLLPKNTRPTPAATDTGLETVEHQYWHTQTYEWLPTGFPDRYRKDGFLVRELVTRSQAVELLAAERAEKEKIAAAVKKLEAAWRDHSQKVATLETQLAAAKKALETKSAANEALSKSVVESIDTEKRLREALEPFSKFAGAVFERNFNNTDVIFEISASDGGVLELTGKDFFEARAVLGGKSS